MVEIAGVAPVGRAVEERPARVGRTERTEAVAPAGGPPRYRGARPVAPISPPTAVYDRAGRYPAVFLFQIARPKPPPPPFGDLFVDEGKSFRAPPSVVGALVGRFAPRGPGAGALLDARV